MKVFYFKRANPDYHPYILRLYCGVLFWIQCLRAGNDVNTISLTVFSITIPWKLSPFQALSSDSSKLSALPSQSFPIMEKVYPCIPAQPSPARRDAFMRNLLESYFLPNVPGIFALLEDLNRLFYRDPPVYPKRDRHVPVTENAISTFGHKTFGS